MYTQNDVEVAGARGRLLRGLAVDRRGDGADRGLGPGLEDLEPLEDLGHRVQEPHDPRAVLGPEALERRERQRGEEPNHGSGGMRVVD